VTFVSTKTYGHDLGLSAAFRQWRAASHCSRIHGYALRVRLEFEAEELDGNNWVMDFGGLKQIKAWLESQFDHKLLVAADDPALRDLINLQTLGLADIVIIPATGCEAFANMVFKYVDAWLDEHGHTPRVRLSSVEVCEHGANSAIYRP